jgi:ribosomal protein S18 acetylase RimI-like enzyme
MKKGAEVMVTATVLKIKQVIQRDMHDFGLPSVFKDLAFKGINELVFFKVFRCMKTCRLIPQFCEISDKYTCRFLTPEESFAFAKREEFKLSEKFVRNAIESGHQCYAILDGDFLANYGWYSNTPTVVTDELIVKFRPDYIYGYNVFTHPKYRGQRLNAVHAALTLNEFLKRGYKGVLAYVEDSNYRALRSFYRAGSEDVGKIYILKALGRYFIHESAGCKDYGFSVESQMGNEARAATVS